jgi:hypothetical protein
MEGTEDSVLPSEFWGTIGGTPIGADVDVRAPRKIVSRLRLVIVGVMARHVSFGVFNHRFGWCYFDV